MRELAALVFDVVFLEGGLNPFGGIVVAGNGVNAVLAHERAVFGDDILRIEGRRTRPHDIRDVTVVFFVCPMETAFSTSLRC